MISKLYGFLSFNERALRKLTQVRLCSGRPQKCTVHSIDDSGEEVEREYNAKLIENKKVTGTLGNALNFESSVQVSKEYYRLNAFNYVHTMYLVHLKYLVLQYSLIQKNGDTFATVYSSKCVTVFLNQTIL